MQGVGELFAGQEIKGETGASSNSFLSRRTSRKKQRYIDGDRKRIAGNRRYYNYSVAPIEITKAGGQFLPRSELLELHIKKRGESSTRVKTDFRIVLNTNVRVLIIFMKIRVIPSVHSYCSRIVQLSLTP